MARGAERLTRYVYPQPFTELDHTADVGVVVTGASAEECLARLVLSFTALTLGQSQAQLADVTEQSIEVEGADAVTMAIDVLRELLYLFDTQHRVPTACVVRRFDEERGALVKVELASFSADDEVTDLKAVTWHEAHFACADQWRAQVIYDV